MIWDHFVDQAGIEQAEKQLEIDMLDTVLGAQATGEGEGEGGTSPKAKGGPKKASGGEGEQMPLPFPQRNSPPVEGAQRARDGHWYIRHPNGKYLMVG